MAEGFPQPSKLIDVLKVEAADQSMIRYRSSSLSRCEWKVKTGGNVGGAIKYFLDLGDCPPNNGSLTASCQASVTVT